jgi:hypothetical protein
MVLAGTAVTESMILKMKALKSFEMTGTFDNSTWYNILNLLSQWYHFITVGRDGSVGIAIRYGLDGPWIESRGGAGFSATVQNGPGDHPASHTMSTG